MAKGPMTTPLNWTCTVPNGACTPASGSGNVDTTFDLEVGESADIQIFGPLDPNVGFVEIEAQAMLPEGIPSFLDQDNKVMFIRAGREGLFNSGFE